MAYTFKHGDRPLDEFTIQRAVGSGGFGEVYYAVSDGGREVALKYLKQNPDVELRGVSHCINLKSPHLVSIFDVKKNAQGEYFIIMEYCSGPSLRDLLIAEPGGFLPEKAAYFVREIAKGLVYLHDRGIVHRDMKPGNIFYDDGYVKIGDYGLSKFIAVSRHSLQTASVGTVHYMAPEIGSGDYSRGVDIYALGVILYEMLLGKVPFEGSTMGEVLMKHLTISPAIEGVPEPFGRVIGKALQKDPKDRFQTVEEMVDELLAVDEVQKSLAGFSTKSLDGAVRQGVADPLESPVPSPNPSPVGDGAGGAAAAGDAAGRRRRRARNLDARVEFPKRLAHRMDRISRKVEKKLAKLGGRVPPPPLPTHAPWTPGMRPHPAGVSADSIERRRRRFLSLLLAIALSVGLAVVVGLAYEQQTRDSAAPGAPAGVGSAMLALAMAGAVLLSRRAARWFGVLDGPKWARFSVRLGCSAPIMAIGASPILGEIHGGVSVWLGMLIVATFARWEKGCNGVAQADVNLWRAVWTALGGAIATSIASSAFGVDNEQLTAIGAGIAGVVSVIVQSVSWWQPVPRGSLIAHAGSYPDAPSETRPTDAAAPGQPSVQVQGERSPPHGYVGHEKIGDGPPPSPYPVDMPPYCTRWGVTRAMWGLVAFLCVGGAIVAFVAAQIVPETEMRYDEVTRLVIACIACVAAMVFAVRKTTPIKRDGFWQESVRPLITSVALFGIGATITGIARNWDWLSGEQRGGVVAGLIISTVMLSVGTYGWRRRQPSSAKPFFSPCEDSACGSAKDNPAGGANVDQSPTAG